MKRHPLVFLTLLVFAFVAASCGAEDPDGTDDGTATDGDSDTTPAEVLDTATIPEQELDSESDSIEEQESDSKLVAVDPTCADIKDIELQYPDAGCAYINLGWAVRWGACQEVEACATSEVGFYETQDACNAACVTPQRICMESEGQWMGIATDRWDHHPTAPDGDACEHYECGEKISECSENPPCNCGPSANYDDELGCVVDESCSSLNSTCLDYDFATDYTPSCGSVVPVVGHYGLVDGVCNWIFGCPEDFDGPDAIVDSSYWFTSKTACEAACSDRCWSDEDCPVVDPAKQYYCQFEANSNCGEYTGGGTCTEKGGACAMVFNPVCGCSGDNISSKACVTVEADSIAYDGECFTFPELE